MSSRSTSCYATSLCRKRRLPLCACWQATSLRIVLACCTQRSRTTRLSAATSEVQPTDTTSLPSKFCSRGLAFFWTRYTSPSVEANSLLFGKVLHSSAQRMRSPKREHGMCSHSPRKGERPRSSCLAAVVVIVAPVATRVGPA